MTTDHQPNVSKDATQSRDILAQFADLLDSQSSICTELEIIADGLPDAIDLQTCLRAAQKLLPVVKTAHDFEESVIFPMLKKQIDPTGQLATTVERLRYEHWGDEEYALDVHHALREFARQRDRANIDSLAWILRGFFEGLRRHLAFDREYVLPILKELAIVQSKPTG